VYKILTGITAVLVIGTSVAHADTASVVESSDLQEIVVTGTRLKGLRVDDSPAPIQVLSADALMHNGSTDFAQAMATNVPSFTVQAWGGDVGNNILQASLRGLSPNDTLVLIDGKRRHGTASFSVLGGIYGGPFQGGAATDFNFIPTAMIDHVEILTDGAAAQYGSDAIAGVVNIILKKSDNGGVVSGTTGQYFDGGGQTAAGSANVGFRPFDGAFVNVTAETKNHDHSVRSALDPRLTNFPVAASRPDYPYVNKVLGDAQSHVDNFAYNAGYNFGNDWNAYSFGTYGRKSAESFENWRPPSKLPTVYPLGFSPEETVSEQDYAFTAGIKGTGPFGWTIDLSSTYGSDHVDLYGVDSANVSLFNDTGFTPSTFYTGGFVGTQWTNNLDFTHNFDVSLASPMNVAFGLETRHETYEIKPGDAPSRYKEGTQAFPGFSLTDAGSHNRSIEAVYIDIAVSPVQKLMVDVAGRAEHYTDAGNTTVGKLTARYNFAPSFALRGTVSTGFRAPTLVEEYYSATNAAPLYAFAQLPPNSPAAQQLGIHKLEPEKSRNFSVGMVLHPVGDLIATLDAYQINIDKRIVGSGTVYGSGNPLGPAFDSAAVTAAIAANGNVLDPEVSQTGINIFSNGVDTRTRGAEMVINLPLSYGAAGHVDWSLTTSWNETKVTKVLQTPTQILPQQLYDQTAISILQNESPKFRVIGGVLWNVGHWTVNLRESVYGSSSNRLLGDDGVWYQSTIATKALTDLEVNYEIFSHLKLAVGANNLFNVYPNKMNAGLLKSYFNAQDNQAVLQYPGFSPFGFNGGFYYGRVTYSF
jgi:iron complex outermembrane recepter protein